MAEIINMTVNGIKHKIACTGKESLLEILREHLGLTGTKEGCGYGVCGSCTVIINGDAVTACNFRGKDKLEFCTPGFIMRLYALFTKNPNASEDEICEALSKHLCRCTGYEAIWEAALLAQKRITNSS